MPEDDKFVKAATFLKNAKPGSTLKMSDFFAASEAKKNAEKKDKDTSIQAFFAQAKAKAKADKEAKEAQAAKEAEKAAAAEKAAEPEEKSLFSEVRGAMYTDEEYADMSALAKRWADIRTLGQIVRAGYVEGKREARHWFNHTKFGHAVGERCKELKKYGSTGMDYLAKGCKAVKGFAGDGVDLVWRGMKAGYHYSADKAKAAKDWFVNTAVVQGASRRMRKLGSRTAEAGRSVAHNFRKLFGIRELTEEEKKARAEEKQKKAEEKAARKQREKEEKEKQKAEKKKKKEEEKKLKAFEKAMKATKDPSKFEEMQEAYREAVVNGLESLGERYDKLMKQVDLRVQSQVQKDNIDEIIRRRMDKGYDARMKEFKERMDSNPDISKKLKYRLDGNRWKAEFDEAKKRAEEEKKKKNGGKTEEKKETSILKAADALAAKAKASKTTLDAVKKGQIGNASDYVKYFQNFETAYANLKEELKKREEEEKQKAEAAAAAAAGGEQKTEEQKTEEQKAAENTAETEEKKAEEKSKLQQAADKTKEIATAAVNVANTAYNNARTGLVIQDNVLTVADDVKKLLKGEGSEKEAAEAVKKSTDTLKKAGSFFGWDPSSGTAYVDKGADTLALFGKTRQDLTKRMQKIQEGKATAEDYLAFETGITTLAQNCLSYAKIDTPYITSFNKALTGMVEISKGKKVSENILSVGQQLLTTANEIEKKITGGAGSLGTPINILGSMSKIAGNMESFIQKSEQNERLMAMSEEEMGKNLTKEEAGIVSNGRDDIVGRNDISRYQLLGGAVKKAAETTVGLVSGTIGTLYFKAAQPAFDALNKFMTEALEKSLSKSLIRKDIFGTEDNYRIEREMGGMRNDEIMRILRRETGSVGRQHLADKIRLDLGMRLMKNENKDNGFEALIKNAFGRKATDEEILQLVGFKDFSDAENRVYKAAEKDDKLRTNYQKPAKDALATTAKQKKKAAEEKKKDKALYDALDDLLDPEGSNALLPGEKKKKVNLFMEDNDKNMVSFKNSAPQSKKQKSMKK